MTMLAVYTTKSSSSAPRVRAGHWWTWWEKRGQRTPSVLSTLRTLRDIVTSPDAEMSQERLHHAQKTGSVCGRSKSSKSGKVTIRSTKDFGWKYNAISPHSRLHSRLYFSTSVGTNSKIWPNIEYRIYSDFENASNTEYRIYSVPEKWSNTNTE